MLTLFLSVSVACEDPPQIVREQTIEVGASSTEVGPLHPSIGTPKIADGEQDRTGEASSQTLVGTRPALSLPAPDDQSKPRTEHYGQSVVANKNPGDCSVESTTGPLCPAPEVSPLDEVSSAHTTSDISAVSDYIPTPADLGRLWSLETIRLSGNMLTGCIPVALESVATSDLASLNLPYCSPPAPGSLSATSSSETSVTLSWDAVSNTDMYRLEYRGGPALDWTVVTTTSTSTSQTMEGLRCDVRYLFRVGAHGSGTRYAADWSEPSAPIRGLPSECVPPTFSTSTYTFSVSSDAEVGTPVGTTTATGSVPGESVTYSIGGDDRFAIASSTGRITISGDLSTLAGTSTDLTVRARDESGGTATVMASVTVIRGCSGGVAVPNPGSNPGLLDDCRTLLSVRDTLAGAATLNWSGDVAMSDWDGVTVRGTPRRVTRLELRRSGLTGEIPAELGLPGRRTSDVDPRPQRAKLARLDSICCLLEQETGLRHS